MKMSYRHQSTIMLLIIVMVSVFLFSCGIPSYWEPSNETVISKNSTNETDTVSFNVAVNYYEDQDGNNAPNIGLLLLYVYTNTLHGSSNSSFDAALVKEFNSSYRGTIPNGLSTLRALNNTPVWSFIYDEETFYLYAFTDANGDAVKAFQYNKEISNTESFSTQYTLKLKETKTEGVELYVENSTTADCSLRFGLNDSNLRDLDESSYIHVYAAISAQGDNYSNLYWSNLVYVGSFGE